MSITDCNMQGGYITLRTPEDKLLGNRYELVAFNLACPVFFSGCSFYNSMGVLDVTDIGHDGVNAQNHALRIEDPGEIDAAEWCIVHGATFDRCYFQVIIQGRGNEIHYDAPPEMIHFHITKKQREEVERYKRDLDALYRKKFDMRTAMLGRHAQKVGGYL